MILTAYLRSGGDSWLALATASACASDAEGEGRLVDENDCVGMQLRCCLDAPRTTTLLRGECVARCSVLAECLRRESGGMQHAPDGHESGRCVEERDVEHVVDVLQSQRVVGGLQIGDEMLHRITDDRCVVAALVLLAHLAGLLVECDVGVDGAAWQARCGCDLRGKLRTQMDFDMEF
jgi:hypothetical protein